MRTLVTTSTIALLAFIAMGSASAQILSASVNANRGGSGPFDLVGQISYSYSNASQRLISLRTQQPVLCADFGTSANVLRFQPRDPNGDLPIEGNLLGISAAAYNVTQRRLNIESGTSEPVLRCRVPLIAGATGADLVFANGFETTGIDLAVTINTPSVALTPSTLNYTIVVRNLGGADATSVKVREFFTIRRPSTGPAGPGLMGGTWSCLASGSASCGQTTGGNGRLTTSGASIPAGGGNFLTFRLERAVLANTTPNAQVVLAAAAFHAPAGSNDDIITANDAEQRRVVITDNRPPIITFLSNSCVSFVSNICVVGDEDATQFSPVGFTVTDPDVGDTVLTPTVQIGNSQVFANGTFSGSQPNFALTLSGAGSDANGSSNLTVRAVDTRGAEAEPVTITARITPINDPPTVVLSGMNCRGANNIALTEGNPFVIALSTSTDARNVRCTGFLTTTAGPDNETGQSVTVAAPTLAGDSIFSSKGAPRFTNTGGGVYDFEFLLNPATSPSSACISSSATDNGDATPPNANNKQFRVRLNIGSGNTGVSCAPAP